MTDGDAPDPSGLVRERNNGGHGISSGTVASPDYTRIFTYAFGAGVQVLLFQL